ncbi:hypothetical protein CAOG_05421 [Capsaspora owczarzaki ATCC 30864]|uniref:Acid phosphatase n=1 Tax=Capsaspora owczarzaki (strain ATCC 30864) TaxID=595528 RepID=A0A0D2WRZ6_CAPO3|nr:hypothetical protein CAOG_05421 [Capsaspora owczarzaki ATCC 30864]KJE94850.1 hypothetical protein CAOG_005421 [Capsaspora owczarzaki ATCC 30864]|eukprot:XP_004346094.1 hypothetical protein CAOG_05421 [Capsaspora owczarzaki ATCC 30864]
MKIAVRSACVVLVFFVLGSSLPSSPPPAATLEHCDTYTARSLRPCTPTAAARCIRDWVGGDSSSISTTSIQDAATAAATALIRHTASTAAHRQSRWRTAGGWIGVADAAELVQVQVLSRHGNRAPNVFVKYLCPPEKINIKQYGVPPAALTRRGLLQLQQLGAHIRQVYMLESGFLCDKFAVPANSTCVRAGDAAATTTTTTTIAMPVTGDDIREDESSGALHDGDDHHEYNGMAEEPNLQSIRQPLVKKVKAIVPMLESDDLPPLIPKSGRVSPSLPCSNCSESESPETKDTGLVLATWQALSERTRASKLQITRDTHDFLTDVHVRTSGGSRCMESALATVLGLYPDALDYGSPVPLHVTPVEHDHFLEVRHAGCKLQWKKDNRVFKDNGSVAFAQANPNEVAIMSRVCKLDLMQIENQTMHRIHLVRAIKEISDAFIFDDLEGMTLTGNMTKDELSLIHGFAHRMLRIRYFNELRKITYWAGEIPNVLLGNFKAAMKRRSGTKRLYIYHGHRENLYAIAELLHLELSDLGIPKTAILPAATLFFELYRRDEDEQAVWEIEMLQEQERRAQVLAARKMYHDGADAADTTPHNDEAEDDPGVTLDFDRLTSAEESKFGADGAGKGVEREFFVRAFMWRPCDASNKLCRPYRKPIRIHDCAMDCPLAQVRLRAFRHIARTGPWTTLCDYPANSDIYKDAIIDNLGQSEHLTVPYFTPKWWMLQELRANPWPESVESQFMP